MIHFACQGCGKKLHAKDELAGRTAKCPNCRQPITIPEAPEPSNAIPLDDAEPGEHVIPASEEHVATLAKIERLNRESHYVICSRTHLMATWSNNGAGWMVRAGVGFLPAKRAKEKLPDAGEFQLTELKFTMTPEGKRLSGIASYRLVSRYALTVLDQGDDNIVEKIAGPGHLNRDQKIAVRQALKDQFMRPVYQDSTAVLEYLSGADVHSQGVE
jgi:DNA-directed RNA polymerase subunit RPC12/RpoP